MHFLFLRYLHFFRRNAGLLSAPPIFTPTPRTQDRVPTSGISFNSSGATCATTRNQTVARPLKSFQWTDGSIDPDVRIHISGRFSDVCAELERLAALEAA